MSVILRYRGREVQEEDLPQIRDLIADCPKASRRELSRRLCEVWNWRQQNGALRDMVCRGLMLALHRAGHIRLPEVRKALPNPFVECRRPSAPVGLDESPIEMSLRELGPLVISQVRRSDDEALVNGLIEAHHYLRYSRPVGEHLKYLVMAGGRPVACLIWCSAVRHLASRDRHIGWTPELRRRNLHLIAYNTRYLILPWVRVPHLASHLLGLFARRISRDWEAVYRHPIHFLETFITPERYRGTCYKAANWTSLGLTTGRGKNDQTKKANRPLKEVLGYALSPKFRELLMA